jgi:hypothetical protein
VRISRWINIFLQCDSYSPVGFCLTEIPIAMMLEETDGYKMGQPGERDLKKTHSLFIDDLIVKGEGLAIFEERMKALDTEQNEVYKFLGCEQGDKIDVKRVMQRVKKEIAKRLEQLVGMNLNDENLAKAINCRVVPVAGYIMNVCNLRKGDIEKLDM